jgi:hypothetical protein
VLLRANPLTAKDKDGDSGVDIRQMHMENLKSRRGRQTPKMPPRLFLKFNSFSILQICSLTVYGFMSFLLYIFTAFLLTTSPLSAL